MWGCRGASIHAVMVMIEASTKIKYQLEKLSFSESKVEQYLLGLVGHELGTLIVPAGEHGGEALIRRWPRSSWTPSALICEGGMLIFKGFILGGEGISSLSMLSGSSIKDWKNSRILVLGNRIEHLQQKEISALKKLKMTHLEIEHESHKTSLSEQITKNVYVSYTFFKRDKKKLLRHSVWK